MTNSNSSPKDTPNSEATPHTKLIMKFSFLITTLLLFISVALAKEEWPECKDKSGEECKQLILADDASFNVQIIPFDAMVTMDYRTDRVRVRVSPNGMVTSTPRVG